MEKNAVWYNLLLYVRIYMVVNSYYVPLVKTSRHYMKCLDIHFLHLVSTCCYASHMIIHTLLISGVYFLRKT